MEDPKGPHVHEVQAFVFSNHFESAWPDNFYSFWKFKTEENNF